jgi:Flp pilus assembly protein TadG
MRLRSKARHGATVVEFALVGPLTFLLLLGLLVGAMGIFRYFEIAHLARESTRWAAVHGTGYQSDTGNPAASSQDVYNNVIAAKAVGLNLSNLSYSVAWNTTNAPYHTTIVNGKLVTVTNIVSVTINYTWIPEAFLGGITLTSTSSSAMSN